MKYRKILTNSLLVFSFLFFSYGNFYAQADYLVLNIMDELMYDKLKGKILIKTEDKGRAYYINPKTEKAYYLGRPLDAFNIMKEQGLGISENNFNSFNDYASDSLAGVILLRVEASGEAYYVNPVDLKMNYLGRPSDAFRVMQKLGLGISNNDFNILTGSPQNSETVYENISQEVKGSWCIDSDNGNNYYEFGLTSVNGIERMDVCVNDLILREYSCINNLYTKNNRYECSIGCIDGACVYDSVNTDKCFDSDDVGYYEKGYVEVGGEKSIDYCEPDNETVVEYYCDGGEDGDVNTIEYLCDNGCKEGFCFLEDYPVVDRGECVDVDNGDIYTRGLASSYFDGQQMDICKYEKYPESDKEKTMLYEYICNEGGLVQASKQCPYGCKNGACLISE